MHKDIYIIGQKLSKKDKLGIHQTVEREALNILSSLIEAAFSPRERKLRPLEIARVHSTVLQHMVRNECELAVLEEKSYLHLSKQLVNISKEINNWISYVLGRNIK